MKRGEKSATIRSSVRDHYREEVRPVSEHSGSGERTLYDLTPGESGMILSVGNQSGAVKRRLVDMGLTPGTVVKVTKIAPLGDPLEVSLRGYEMSLRRADAAQIRMGQPRRTERGGTARACHDPARDRPGDRPPPIAGPRARAPGARAGAMTPLPTTPGPCGWLWRATPTAARPPSSTP